MTDENAGATRNRLDKLWIFLLAALVLLVIFGFQFVRDPSLTAPTRDPAWYTWRAGIIVHATPGLVPQDWGPFHMFGGGYRVSVPVIGALLQDVAGTDQSSFAAFMMIFIPILAGLAFGAGAYRSTKSPTLYLLSMFVAGVFFLTTPYVGYLDNLFVLYVLAALIGFLEPARTSWGARTAVFLLASLAFFTHPTTCVVFFGSMFFMLLFHIVSMRFDFRKVLARDLPALLAVFLAFLVQVPLWLLGKFLLWGTTGNLADAALPPPYTREFFLGRLTEWVKSQYPLIVIPLVILAVVWIVQRARRDQKPADAYRSMISWWLLPYAASVVFVLAGKVLPYYRFMNSTAAVMPLTAIGLWVVCAWIMKKTNRNVFVATVMLVVLIAAFGFAVKGGLKASKWDDPDNQWIDQPTRVALASVESIAESDPSKPIVFVNNYARDFSAYGWSKTYANVGRAGLRGDVAPRTFQYFGDLENFQNDERTVTNPACDKLVGSESEPDLAAVSKRSECTYDLISRGFLDEMHKGLDENGGTPYVFLVRKFNTNSDNLKYFDQGTQTSAGLDQPQFTPLGPDLLLLNGDGYAAPTQQQVAAALAAGKTEQAYLANHPGPLADPLHLLRVILGLLILMLVPGLIAAPWFEIDGWQMKLGLVPGISLALNILAAIFVISILRSPFGVTPAAISVALAIIAAGLLRLLASRRTAAEPGVLRALATWIGKVMVKGGDMIDAMSVPMREIKSFRALMLTQFISMAGDGVVAGTIFATVTNPQNAKSGKDVMALVFLTYLPFAILAPFVGVLADRYDRRRLLVFVNYARAVLMVAAVALFLLGVDNVALLSAMSLLVLAGFRLMLVVKGAGLPDAVQGHDLLVANSLSQAGGTIFQAMGAIFGAGMAKVFVDMNAGWFAIVAIVLYAFAGTLAKGIDQIAAQTPVGTIGQAFKGLIRNVIEGVKEIGRRPAAAVGILSFWLTRSLVFGFIALSIAFTTVEAIAASGKKGSVVATLIPVLFAGIGAGIGLFLAQLIKDRIAPAKVITTFMFVAGGAALLSPLPGGKFAAAFFAGLAFFLVKIAADTLAQQALPDDFRGRAYAFFDITYALSYAIPAAVLYLASTAGINLSLVIAADGVVVIVLAAALGGWSRKLGLYRHTSDDLAPEEIASGIED